MSDFLRLSCLNMMQQDVRVSELFNYSNTNNNSHTSDCKNTDNCDRV